MASLDALLALASGVPLVLLGALLLRVKPRRPEQVFFGAFAVLWGAQVALANVVRVVEEPGLAAVAFLLAMALIPPAYLFLAHFTVRARPEAGRGLLTWAAAGLAVVASGVLVLAPRAVVATVDPGSDTVAFGPAAVPLFVVPFFGMFYVAIAALYRQWRASRPGAVRAQTRGLLLALMLFASYHAVSSALFFLGPGGFARLQGEAGAAAALFLAGAALLVGLVAHAALRPLEGRDAALTAAFAAPALAALAERGLAQGGVALDTTGVWRLLSVGVLVYVLLRYQLFDVDLRVKWGLRQSTVAAAFLGVFALVTQLTEEFVSSLEVGPYLGVAAAGGLLFVMNPLQTAAERFATRVLPGVREDDAYLDERKVEVYRAALERVLYDGAIDPEEDRLLAELRRSLGIGDEQHEVLLMVARGDVTKRSRAGGKAKPASKPRAGRAKRARR